MLRTTSLLMAATLVGLPLIAHAQTPVSSDQGYCARLSDMYTQYVGPSQTGRRMAVTPDADGGLAVAQCHQGNAAASIPVLERLLTNAGFSLPPRG